MRHLTPVSGFRDLTYAAALAAASERMHACRDAAALLQAVAVEAAALLPADGTAIMAGHGDHWRPLSTPATHLEPDLDHAPVWAVAVARAGLLDPGYLPDLDGVLRLDTRLTDIDKPPGWPPWRSLLVTDLPCPGTDHLRLLWYSHQVAAFHNHLDVAALFTRHTTISLQTAIQRDHRNHETSPSADARPTQTWTAPPQPEPFRDDDRRGSTPEIDRVPADAVPRLAGPARARSRRTWPYQ